ncbi:tyrosine-type recombinase/integrase [Nocardiopsis sp. NPDC057823]|uniref:tyrosine-type recombinase/integrase n=1 Tax=Nocardiopsis sp. NPDC057823 TaxID=3346256 RepID=UPI0036720D11
MEDLVKEFIDARRTDTEPIAENTAKTYRVTLDKFMGYLSEQTDVTEWERVGKRHVRGFLAALRDAGIAQNTLHMRHASLGAFFTWLVAEGEIKESPVKGVARPKETIEPTPLVSEDTMHALLKLEARTRFLTIRNRAILYLLWDGGVRIGELLSITTNSVDMDAMTVKVNGKTGPRTVPFGTATSVALRRYLRARAKYPRSANRPELFLGHRGELKGNAVREMLKAYGSQVGSPGLHPHQFRHTWVHSMLDNGATLKDLMILGGWSSPQQIIERYGLAGQVERAFNAHRRLSPGDRLSAA